jgi:uncharacterized protein (DUF4415 family)
MKMPNPKNLKRVKGPVFRKEDLHKVKTRVTIHLDQDLIDIIRQLALESGGKYQPMLNQILRNALLGKKEGLISRIEQLEKAVFKTKAA